MNSTSVATKAAVCAPPHLGPGTSAKFTPRPIHVATVPQCGRALCVRRRRATGQGRHERASEKQPLSNTLGQSLVSRLFDIARTTPLFGSRKQGPRQIAQRQPHCYRNCVPEVLGLGFNLHAGTSGERALRSSVLYHCELEAILSRHCNMWTSF
jgi:hypothetical protein